MQPRRSLLRYIWGRGCCFRDRPITRGSQQNITTEDTARPSRNRYAELPNTESRAPKFRRFLQLPCPSSLRKSAHASKISNISRTESTEEMEWACPSILAQMNTLADSP